MDIQLEQKLENIADTLVPNHFQENAPQFYDLVKSFLRNIEDVQDSINGNFLDTIDITKIKNSDIIDIYVDTYLNQFDFDEDIPKDSMINLVKVSKSLSVRKGTISLYSILVKLLVYLLSDLSSQFLIKTNELKTATDESLIKQLEEELETLEINNLNEGYSEYYNYDLNGNEQEFDDTSSNNENIIPFKYSFKSIYTIEVFEKYIKPFAHPIGWEVLYEQILRTYVEDTLPIYLRFNMAIMRPLPYTGDEPYRIKVGTEEDYEEYSKKITEQDNLVIVDGELFYDYIPLKTCPKWLELDKDTIIDNGGYLPLTSGFPGLKWGLPNLVAGNTNFAFPIKVLPYSFIPDYMYMSDKHILKETDVQPNKPIYTGTKRKILDDGTTRGSDYVKDNQFNVVNFDLFPLNVLVSTTQNYLVSSSGDWLISSTDFEDRALTSESGNWVGSDTEGWLIGDVDNWGNDELLELQEFVIGTNAACVGGGLVAGGKYKAYSRNIVNDIEG